MLTLQVNVPRTKDPLTKVLQEKQLQQTPLINGNESHIETVTRGKRMFFEI